MEGGFEGVKKHPNVKVPEFKVTGYYETVRYGELCNFVLLIPENAKIESVKAGARKTYYLVTLPNGEKYGFGVRRGDAATPDEGFEVPVEEIEKLLEEQRILSEAKDVY